MSARPQAFNCLWKTRLSGRGCRTMRRLSAHCWQEHPDAVGYVFAVGGRIDGGDEFGSAGLFRKLWLGAVESGGDRGYGLSRCAGTRAADACRSRGLHRRCARRTTRQPTHARADDRRNPCIGEGVLHRNAPLAGPMGAPQLHRPVATLRQNRFAPMLPTERTRLAIRPQIAGGIASSHRYDRRSSTHRITGIVRRNAFRRLHRAPALPEGQT